MVKPPTERRAFGALVEIVKDLRGPNGCPWDKEQTHKTLTRFAIEEAHELAEAIDHGDTSHTIEELGDLLLQVVLHAEIGRQEGSFTLEDVIEGICDKMVRRHPHVFGDVNLGSSEAVLTQWTEIKAKEKEAKNKTDKGEGKARETSFELPPNMPALMMSQEIGEKTRKVNFDFSDLKEAFSKVKEEVLEMEKAIAANNKAEMMHELGDIFFSASQVARFFGGDAEQVARLSNQRFEKRFFKMKELATGDFKSLPAAEKERLWQAAKKATK